MVKELQKNTSETQSSETEVEGSIPKYRVNCFFMNMIIIYMKIIEVNGIGSIFTERGSESKYTSI